MCKSYDLVRISVTCCAELDKNQNKRAGTVISVPTWPYLQHPSPQLDIKPATSHKHDICTHLHTGRLYRGPKAGVSGGSAEPTTS